MLRGPTVSWSRALPTSRESKGAVWALGWPGTKQWHDEWMHVDGRAFPRVSERIRKEDGTLHYVSTVSLAECVGPRSRKRQDSGALDGSGQLSASG